MAVLKNKCGISAAWVPGQYPQPKLMEFASIWDTGATNCVVTQAVIAACGLAPTGMAQVHGIHGLQSTETYLVNIVLPDNVMFMGVRVTKGQVKDADILIGMDIIGMGDFAVTNAGGVTKFSYRTPPSLEHIDFVQEHRKAATAPPSTRAERRRAKFGRK